MQELIKKYDTLRAKAQNDWEAARLSDNERGMMEAAHLINTYENMICDLEEALIAAA